MILASLHQYLNAFVSTEDVSEFCLARGDKYPRTPQTPFTLGF